MGDLIFEIISGLVIAALVIISIIAAWQERQARRTKLRELAAALGGRMAGKWWGDYAMVVSEGREARIRLLAEERYAPIKLRLEIIGAPNFRWTVRRKRWFSLNIRFDDLSKLENPDPQLDCLRIGVNDQAQATKFFSEPKNQAAIREFFDHGFTELSAAKELVVAIKNKYQNPDLDPELLRRQLDALRQLAA